MAPFKNKNAEKLSTEDLKKEAYLQYCQHISSGIPKKGWFFDHPEISLTWQTMEKYIKEEPSVFNPIHKQIAEAKSFTHWFNVLASSATGENTKASPASLQMIMRNKFGWDKADNNEEQDSSEVNQNHEKLMAQIAESQTKANGLFHYKEIESIQS